MSRVLIHIQILNPDWQHSVGQKLLLPVSLLFGHSYRIVDDVQELPEAPLEGRVMAAALSLLFFPFALAAAGVGALLLYRSATHHSAYRDGVLMGVAVSLNSHQLVRSRNVVLRRPTEGDLGFYQALFNSRVAMWLYDGGGPRDIAAQFLEWMNRWSQHHFSALVVEEKVTERAIGHMELRHGAYVPHSLHGQCSLQGVGDPAFWNTDLGLEAVRAAVAYARALKARGDYVPMNVSDCQREQLEAVKIGLLSRVYPVAGPIEWVYCPFVCLAASGPNDAGIQKILSRVFLEENGGWKDSVAPASTYFLNL